MMKSLLLLLQLLSLKDLMMDGRENAGVGDGGSVLLSSLWWLLSSST